jgi:hypothetical protein
MSALVKAPINYTPSIKDGKYVDCLAKYKWAEFADHGIKCTCTKSRTIHRNKNSFAYSHCKTKKHQEYLNGLNEESQESSHVADGDGLASALKEIKQMKILLGREHQTTLLEKQRNATMQTQLRELLSDKEEIVAEVKQANAFVRQTSKKILKHEQKIRELEENCKKYDRITQEMMALGGYELE